MVTTITPGLSSALTIRTGQRKTAGSKPALYFAGRQALHQEKLKPSSPRRNPFRTLAVAALALAGVPLSGTSSPKPQIRETRQIQALNHENADTVAAAAKTPRLPDNAEHLKAYQISDATLLRALRANGRVFVHPADQTFESIGSGFFIRSPQGKLYAFSNAHVVNPEPFPEESIEDRQPVRTENGKYGETDAPALSRQTAPNASGSRARQRIFPWGKRSQAFSIVRKDETADIALLRLNDPKFQPAQPLTASDVRDLTSHPLKVGEPLFLVGHPDPKKMTGAVFVGKYEAVYLSNYPTLIGFNGRCVDGTSGAAVFDGQGRLVGMNRFGTDPPRDCWAIPAKQLQAFITQAESIPKT